MRITNKVIQNNSLNNINTNKLLQDKLSQQMSTEKKVNRPSDDPIVAIRALRLRTNVNQVNQYYEKNVPDAESWLHVTESALSSMSEVVTDMIAQCTKGSDEYLKTSDRETIITALKALRDEVYSTGNADYAGRYIFTGYRTDTTLTFTEDVNRKYVITEQFQNSKIDTVSYVDTGDILKVNDSNYTDAGYKDIVEQQVSQSDVHRIRLSYENLDIDRNNPNYKIQVWTKPLLDENGVAITDEEGNEVGGYAELTEIEVNGQATAVTYTSASIYDEPSPYKDIDENSVILIEETGEMLLGQNVYDKLMSLQDDAKTKADEGEFRVTYEKSKWNNGDLRPEHYFACTACGDKNIEYNKSYLEGIDDEEKQSIEYDVGLNQTIRVNTTADEVFTHDITRDVDDMVKMMEETVAMEKQVKKLEGILEKAETPEEKAIVEKQLAAAQKAFTYLNEKTQKVFEAGISKMQGHLDAVNYAVTENGTRGQKLELISNRLMSRKTNFETLRSENEDVDITEVAIKLSSAELTYSSALMATGKVLQNNLMNFI